MIYDTDWDPHLPHNSTEESEGALQYWVKPLVAPDNALLRMGVF